MIELFSHIDIVFPNHTDLDKFYLLITTESPLLMSSFVTEIVRILLDLGGKLIKFSFVAYQLSFRLSLN